MSLPPRWKEQTCPAGAPRPAARGGGGSARPRSLTPCPGGARPGAAHTRPPAAVPEPLAGRGGGSRARLLWSSPGRKLPGEGRCTARVDGAGEGKELAQRPAGDSACRPGDAWGGGRRPETQQGPRRGAAGCPRLHAPPHPRTNDHRPAPRTGEAPAEGGGGVRLGSPPKRTAVLPVLEPRRHARRRFTCRKVTARAAPSRDPWVEARPARPSTDRAAPGKWTLRRAGASRAETQWRRRRGPRPVAPGRCSAVGSQRSVERAHRASCCLQNVTEKKVSDRACLSPAALHANVETQKPLKTGTTAHKRSRSAKA